jgi:hypothetical protein
MRKTNFKILQIWHKGMDIVDLVYQYCEALPNAEKYNFGLTSRPMCLFNPNEHCRRFQ